jgi:hypothetical protein
MMYMSTGAKHAPPSPPDEPDVPELPLVPLLPPKLLLPLAPLEPLLPPLLVPLPKPESGSLDPHATARASARPAAAVTDTP